MLLRNGPNTVEEWRTQVGLTDPAKARQTSPESIRARLAKSIAANLVHGSSDRESVVAEFDWMISKISKLLRNSPELYPSEKELKQRRTIPYASRLIAIGRIPNTSHLCIIFKTQTGTIHTTYVSQ